MIKALVKDKKLREIRESVYPNNTLDEVNTDIKKVFNEIIEDKRDLNICLRRLNGETFSIICEDNFLSDTAVKRIWYRYLDKLKLFKEKENSLIEIKKYNIDFLGLSAYEILRLYNGSTRLVNCIYRELSWKYGKSKPLFKDLKLLYVIQLKIYKETGMPSIRNMGVKTFEQWINIMKIIEEKHTNEYICYDNEINKYMKELEEQKEKKLLERKERDRKYRIYRRIRILIEQVTSTIEDIVILPEELIEYFEEGPEIKLSLPYILNINNKNKENSIKNLTLLYGYCNDIYLIKYNLITNTYKIHTITDVKIQGGI